MDGTSRPAWLNYSQLVEAIPGGVLALDLDGRIIEASPRALLLLGVDASEALGRSLEDFSLAECKEDLQAHLRHVYAGLRESFELFVATPVNKHDRLEVTASPVLERDTQLGAIAVLTAVDCNAATDGKVLARESEFHAIFDSFPFECWALSEEGEFTLQNAASEKVLGPLLTKKVPAVALPAEIVRDWSLDVERALLGESVRRELTMLVDGTRKHFRRIIVPILDQESISGVLGVCVDTTEQRNLEEQLAQSQKLDAIGRLAGGIAHDFNNVLTAIMSCVRLLERRLGGPPRRELQIIREGAQRASELTRQLLAFAKQEMAEPRRTSVDDIVLKSDRLLRRLIGEDIELVTLAEARGFDVIVDPVRLEQAIINLVVNARDAMPKGGKIIVRCSGVELKDSRPSADGFIPVGSYALIQVEDSGVGMSAETKTRAFEPFFTTRHDSGGTGLGLSSVYGSVHQAQGYVTLESTVGKGTSVVLYLPRAEEEPEGAKLPAPEQEPLSHGGSETIMVVEDEPLVMSVACQSLRLSGYTVLQARTLQAALEVARGHEGALDLLLTDVVMPHGSGPELAAILGAERPTMKVLLMSGYTAERISIELESIHFLAKPFTPETLDAKVRKVLDSPMLGARKASANLLD